MMKTGKNKRLLASILAASMLLAMSPFALAAEGTEDTTGQEQSTSQSAKVKTEGSGIESGSGSESSSTTGGNTESGGTGTGGTTGGNTEGGGTGTGGGGTGTGGGGTTEPEKPEAPKSAAKIIDKNEYAFIADALAEAQPGDTIELLRDVTENIKINKSLTLDLHGHTLSGDGKKTVVSISGKDKDMDVTVKNGTITGGYEIKGGGFDIQSGNIKIENCIIEKNTAKAAGGGVNIGGSANVKITGSEIRNNTVTGSSGGAIYLASGSAYDGYYYNCVCEVVDTKLNGNSAVIGGAVGMGASLFHDGINNAYGGKGVTATFMMDGESIIDGNTARYGGAVHLTGNGSRFLMKNGSITNNRATSTEGGAIWATNYGGVTIEKGTISNNTAKRNGGAIYIKANIPATDDFAIKAGVCDVLNLGEVLITNNSAKQGGGIYIDSYDSAYGIQADLKQASIYNNHASDGADDIYSTGKGTEGCTVQLGETADSWKLDCGDTVDNWYIDSDQMGEGTARWNAHPGNGDAYVVPYTQRENLKGVLTLKAAHPLMYTLTYDVTGDLPPEGYTAPPKQTLVNGSSYTVAAVPASVSGSKDGVNGTFSFNGWKKDDGTVLTGEQQLTADLTLHGVWTFTKNSSGGTDPIEWNVSRSKTATQLDTNTWTSNVTLSLPSAEEALASDVVFVLDKSTSAEKEEQALGMLTALKEQTAKTGAKVKVGVVIFNKQANVTAPLTDLATDSGYKTIEAAIKQGFSSGTNTHAGLLAGKQLLDEDTEVAANRKYLIFVSDGITYMYNAEPTATAWSFKADSWLCRAEPDNWKSKYDNNNPPDDWSEWMNEIGKKVAAQGTAYEYPYGGKATNCTPKDNYKNYANSIDKALYLTYQVYQEAKTMGYNCYAVANESSTDFHWGPAFMRYLANGQRVDFGTIQNDILYAVSAGSTVEDQMGDAFDFVPGSLKLTVGGKELKSKADGNMTYFGNNAENLSENNCRFKVLYAPDADGFVWTINENVSNFAPVQLTYTVKLTKPETDPGTYGVEDLKGEKNVPADKALFTNKRAVLNAINSAGAQLTPLDFPKPSVSYTVKKSSGGGGGGGGRKPTVTIPDDVPTGLNGDDHYAYIVGYPNGNVEPNGNITRAEVATIFFRLLTEEVRTANSTQSNSLSDVTRGQWFNHAVSTLSSMGIVKGHNDGTFAPNAPITRAEFAAIAARFDDKNTDTSSKFTDIASHWAKNEIGVAANKGWINGYPDGTFRPNQYITRAEAMTLVNRVLNRLPENSSDLLDSMIKWPDNSDASAWYYLAVQEATNSHYYKTKENKFEKWTELRKTRDWTELEK
ncbi:S-layer homology domain-containing protein [Agathobaculum sp.]|uniref:S-layer homology domain-containing protein n=1 Tax=Agathobaculum sp. TaxID=2048138 RepID=UPI003AB4E4AA